MPAWAPPADVVRETTPRAVPPCACQGARGPGQRQASPDTVGPGPKGAPVAAHQRVQGWRWGQSVSCTRAGKATAGRPRSEPLGPSHRPGAPGGMRQRERGSEANTGTRIGNREGASLHLRWHAP